MIPLRPTMLLLAATLLTGCLGRPAFMQPRPERDLRSTLELARVAADSGRWATADRHLSGFAQRYPDTDEARETLYWRALFRLAPGNDSLAQRLAIPTLEQYLAKPGGAHRTEARVLLDVAMARAKLEREAAAKEREIAQIRTALGRAQDRPATATTGGAGESPQPDRGLAQEVERLRSELARANQELERIRRRLAGQRP